MNRLRKILAWLWRIKERIVLVTMVAILCHRVYKVIYPDDPSGGPGITVQPPRATLGPDVPPAPDPPGPPPGPDDLVVSQLWTQNMFIYRPGGGAGTSDTGEELPPVKLKRITGNPPRVNVETATDSSLWLSAGENFETYQLMRIDPDGCEGKGAITIYDESRRKTFEICRE